MNDLNKEGLTQVFNRGCAVNEIFQPIGQFGAELIDMRRTENGR